MTTQPTGLLERLCNRYVAHQKAQRIEAIHATTREHTEQMRDELVSTFGYTHADVTRLIWETLPDQAASTKRTW